MVIGNGKNKIMTPTITLIVVILSIYFLGKYAIEEGQRIEQNKKLKENLKKFNKTNENTNRNTRKNKR